MREKILHPGKRIVLTFIVLDVILCLIVLWILFVCHNRASLMYSQMAGERWGNEETRCSQVSVFYSDNGALGPADIQNIRSNIFKKLYQDAYIEQYSDNRKWIDAYAGHTLDTLRKDSNTLMVNVHTVGGDFFAINPIPLKSGNYPDLESDDVNQILLDEYVAWNLFGGNNIAGMKLWIGDKVFTITGVVAVSEEDAERQAYGNYYSVYVPMAAYAKNNTGSDKDYSTDDVDGTKADCYMAVLPNPIKNYALNTVAEAAGITFKTDEEKEESRSSLEFGDMTIVENTGRYGIISLLGKLKESKYADMRSNAIVFPYWENVARYEERFQINCVRTCLILLILPLISLIYLFVWLYANRRVALYPFKLVLGKIDAAIEARKVKKYEELEEKKKLEEEKAREENMQAAPQSIPVEQNIPVEQEKVIVTTEQDMVE